MRELTIDELDLVSGGYDPYDDGEEIVVTGSRGGSGSGYSMSWSQYQGMQSFYGSSFGSGGGSFYGGGSAAPAPTHHPDGTDNDGDGINETPPIVVTATQAQVDAAQYHYRVAWLTFYGLLGSATGALGWAGRAGSVGGAGAAGTTVLGGLAEQAINNMADLNYRRDAADGIIDGNFDPGYITGDRTLPRP
jgi:hypothetical protein